MCRPLCFSYDKDDDEDKEDLNDVQDVDPGKLDDDSWGGSRGYRQSSRDGRQGPIPTFRAYSSEEFKQRDREYSCTVLIQVRNNSDISNE